MGRPAVTPIEQSHLRNIAIRMPLLNLVGYVQLRGADMKAAYMQLHLHKDPKTLLSSADLEVWFQGADTPVMIDVLDVEDVHNDIERLGPTFVRAGVLPEAMYTALRYSGAV